MTMKYLTLLITLFLIHPAVSQSQNVPTVPQDPIETPEQSDPTPILSEEDVQQESSEADTEESAASDETSEIEPAEEVLKITNLISFTKILVSILILISAWVVNKFVNSILENISERTTNYRLFIKRITPITRILIWSTAIYIVIAGVISPPFETVIAISASIGIAVGFASQDILRNIFGGIMIILDRPFQVGDKIQVGDHYGEVKSVGLRSCLIETPDDSIVAIPNGELMNRAVSNANSSALDCQVVSEIYIPATADITLAKEIATKAVYSSPYLYLNKPVVVIALNEIHNRHYIIKLRVKAYVLDIRYEFLFKSDVTEMILSEFNTRGIVPHSFMNENASEETNEEIA